MRSTKLLDIHEVLTRLRQSPDSRQSVYNLIRDAGFPTGFRINGTGKRLWSESEVMAWILGQAKKHSAIVKRVA